MHGERIRCAAVPIDASFWERRAVLLTGHTGFKGAWLSLWLQSLGARVSGLAQAPPSQPSLYELAKVGERMDERAVDIRDVDALREALREIGPEVVIHLAAQPLVRRSLMDPLGTFEVNVMGTANVLEAVRLERGAIGAVVVVTSDKCYENPQGHAGDRSRSDPRRFVESDPLGGNDPYSSSKACAELVAAAYRRSFFSSDDAPRLGCARAGNVIGGGDWGADRLIPDALRAMSGQTGGSLRVRNPDAVRPWQHVLNPLSGYLILAQELWRSQDAAQAWNFGPADEDVRPVRWVLDRLGELWGGALRWELDDALAPPEAGWLALDSGRAERLLGWRAVWSLERGLEEVVRWHDGLEHGQDARSLSLDQIGRFLADAEAHS